MSFLYPYTIQVSRPNLSTTVGEQPYSGLLASDETVILSGIRAHIEHERQGTSPTAKLPGDAAGQSIWKIDFKAARGSVRNRDIITDDLGKRYQIISASWEPLGYSCHVQIMET